MPDDPILPTAPLPGKAAVATVIAAKLREHSDELHLLVDENRIDWLHLEQLQKSIRNLDESIARGRQMFGWLDQVQGVGTLDQLAGLSPVHPILEP